MCVVGGGGARPTDRFTPQPCNPLRTVVLVDDLLELLLAEPRLGVHVVAPQRELLRAHFVRRIAQQDAGQRRGLRVGWVSKDGQGSIRGPSQSAVHHARRTYGPLRPKARIMGRCRLHTRTYPAARDVPPGDGRRAPRGARRHSAPRQHREASPPCVGSVGRSMVYWCWDGCCGVSWTVQSTRSRGIGMGRRRRLLAAARTKSKSTCCWANDRSFVVRVGD